MIKNFLWSKLIPFVYTFLFAFIIVNVWHSCFDKNRRQSKNNSSKQKSQALLSKGYEEQGTGFSGSCFGKDDPRDSFDRVNNAKSVRLEIIYKPKPKYTEEAKNNNVQGTVKVRVTFLPNGNIGSVKEVAGLPFGLTDKAIEAAKKIKFKPQTVNGEPVAVTKVVAYNFTIY